MTNNAILTKLTILRFAVTNLSISLMKIFHVETFWD